MKVLENDVVKLMPLEPVHMEGLWRAAAVAEIWAHMSVDLTVRGNLEQYVRDAQAKRAAGTDSAFVIADAQTEEIVGATWFLDISMPHKRLEIGSTWLHPKAWRTNINTNCKYLLLSYCFEELGMNRVQIKTGHENIRSQRAIERIGAVKEGVLRNHMIRKEGNIRHTVMYSITKEDWPQVKERLGGMLVPIREKGHLTE